MNNNLRVTMPLSLSPLFCQYVILLVSFEGIVCPYLDFVIESFGIADVYSSVLVEGDTRTGRFVFKKGRVSSDIEPKIMTNYFLFAKIIRNVVTHGTVGYLEDETIDNKKQHVVQFHDMIRRTFTVEKNYPNVVSFYKVGADGNYNIKFASEGQAYHFAKFKAVSGRGRYRVTWARIYSNWRPVVMAYDNLDNGDIGFKFLDNGDYPDPDERLEQLPYRFKRSEIQNQMKIRAPQTLYLRNKTRAEDYEIQFKSINHLLTFVQLFPERTNDEHETADYYFMPIKKENEKENNIRRSENINGDRS